MENKKELYNGNFPNIMIVRSKAHHAVTINDDKVNKHALLRKIPCDWELCKVSKLTIEHRQGYYTKEEYSENGKYYLLRGMDLNSPNVSLVNSPKVNASKEDYELYKVQIDDFLFVRSGNIGSYGIIESEFDDAIFASYLIRFKFDQNRILNKYFGAFYSSDLCKNQLNKITQGSSNININANNIKWLEIPLPPIHEQKGIAHLLSLMDSVINKNNQLIAQKELRKKWLMQNLLTGKKRLKGFSGDWKKTHIQDVAKEVCIKNKEDKELIVLSCTKYDGLVPSLEYFGRKIFADDVSAYKIVPKNHFAYATNHIEEGSIGYQDSFEEALISPMYTVFKTDPVINDFYFFNLLKTHTYIHQYQARMEGSIDRRGGLRWEAFSKIKIHIPDIDEQTAIAQVHQTADKEIQLLKAKTGKLKEQKKGLMQVLLTGKKRFIIK